jgi:MFS family permease
LTLLNKEKGAEVPLKYGMKSNCFSFLKALQLTSATQLSSIKCLCSSHKKLQRAAKISGLKKVNKDDIYICCMFVSTTGSPRLARIAVSVFFFIAGICFASWASRIPDIQRHLHLNEAGLGTVLFALPVGSMLSLPVAGILVTKFGSRNIMLFGAIGYALLLCLLGIVDATWQLVTVLFFFGISGNFMNISINTQAVNVEASYGRSIIASFHGLWSMAGFTGAAIGSFMIAQTIQPFIHFLLIASLVALLIVFVFRHSLQHDAVHADNQSGFAWPDKSLLRLGVIAFCCMACEGCMFDWSGIYFREAVHAPKQLITLGYTAFMAMMATGRFVGDRLVTKIGAKHVLQMSGCVIALGLLTSILFPNLYTATVGFLLTGFGVSSVVPLTYGLAGKSNTISTGMAIAAVSTVGYLGFLFGPPVIGYIAQAANLRWSFALVALLGSFITVLATKLKVKNK